MANTTPNKESIRRICILHGGSYCYLNVNTGSRHVDVLSDIDNLKMNLCLADLEEWCGMEFKLYNEQSSSDQKDRITSFGTKILPINLE